MIPAHPTGVRRAANLRSGAHRILWLLAVPVLVTACTSSPSSRDPDPSQVVSSLGAVPIATAPANNPPATASVGHPALLAIGEPVRVSLPGAEAVVTALGPEQVVTAPPSGTRANRPPQSTRAVITLEARATKGSLSVAAADLSSRDDTGTAIALIPQGPPIQTAATSTRAVVKVAGTFTSGAAQVTWRHAGDVLAVWTFNIELD